MKAEYLRNSGQRSTSSPLTMCLICKESLLVLKKYNLKHHYETKTQRLVRLFYGSAKNNELNEIFRM
jgi:hypothetical protein